MNPAYPRVPKPGDEVLPLARELIEHAGTAAIAFMQCDPHGLILRRNTYFTELFGTVVCWDAAAWLSLLHPDDHPRFVKNVRESAHKRESVVIREVTRVRRAGAEQYRWVEFFSVLRLDEQGQPRDWLTFFKVLPSADFFDARVRDAAHADEKRYHALFDHASDATFLVHRHIIIDANEAALHMHGLTREQFVGLHVSKLVQPIVGGVDRAERLGKLRKDLDEKGVAHSYSTIQAVGSGQIIDVEMSFVRIIIDGEQFDLCTHRDITAQNLAARRQQETNAELALHNRNLAWLREASERIYAQSDMVSLAQEAVACLQSHYSVPQVHFVLSEPGGQRVIATSQRPDNDIVGQLRTRSIALERAKATADHVLIIRDIDSELADTRQYQAELRRRGVNLCVLIMLMDQERELGLVCLEYSNPDSFTAIDLDSLKLFARTLALVVAKAKHLAAIEHQATHDALTGLYNRSVLHREFERWRARADDIATLMLLDLDRFKEINDTLGHHVGDDLLRQIGARIQSALGDVGALLCRLGGDEFAVLICGQLSGVERSMAVALSVLSAIRQPFLINGVQLEISASIGVALYPRQAADSHELLRFADVAMYEAKRSGAGVMLYDARLDLNSPQRLRMIVELNQGIRQRELVLHYQPKLDLRTQEIVGCEALVRWQHPQQGLLSPDVFLPLAEVGETIHELTAYVIAEAVAQQRRWQAQGLDLHVAVNLSARNLIDDRVVCQLEALLREHALVPGSFELEITETALMHDPRHAIDLLQRIAALGVGLAIDDFGTGYSSFAYLQRLPIETLKIDRSFVRDMLDKPQDTAIVQSMVALGHNLNKRVVAEGVETIAAMDALRAMDCDLVQGYFLSKPMAASELPDWVAAYAAARQV